MLFAYRASMLRSHREASESHSSNVEWLQVHDLPGSRVCSRNYSFGLNTAWTQKTVVLFFYARQHVVLSAFNN